MNRNRIHEYKWPCSDHDQNDISNDFKLSSPSINFHQTLPNVLLMCRRRRFSPKIYVLECDSAMKIQSFLCKNKKNPPAAGIISLLKCYLHSWTNYLSEKKGAHIYSWTNYLPRARAGARAGGRHPAKSQFRITLFSVFVMWRSVVQCHVCQYYVTLTMRDCNSW